jgi:hypothetical protein
MVMANMKKAAAEGRNLDPMDRRTRRPSTAPAYYLGRPAWMWLAVFRHGSSHRKAVARTPGKQGLFASSGGWEQTTEEIKVNRNILDLPIGAQPDPDEFIRAAMEWHFNPETASAYWLRRTSSPGATGQTPASSGSTRAAASPSAWSFCATGGTGTGRGRMPAWTRTGLRGM